MTLAALTLAVLFAFDAHQISGTVLGGSGLRFEGRTVTVTEPKTDEFGQFASGPVSLCLEGPPRKQCYTTSADVGRDSRATIVELKPGLPALFFSTGSRGVSGWTIQFALLRPGDGTDLRDLLLPGTTVSNQSQIAFWSEPSMSEAQVFVTADYVLGPTEGHFGAHRYVVSVFVMDEATGKPLYRLEDRFTTRQAYDLDAGDNVLGSERPAILARLDGINAARRAGQQRTPAVSK